MIILETKTKEQELLKAYLEANASETLIEKIKNDEVKYDFVEVMACKGGCIGGGGQPKTTKVINDKIRI